MTDSGSGQTMIEIDGLRYSSAGRVIFDGLSLSVSRGKITAIMGPSGTGKTTMLRMITGQLKPAAGRVTVAGQDVPHLNRTELFRLRRRMGMLFQNSALLTDYTVFENIAFPVREHTRLPERLIRTLVLTKLHAVGLRGAAGLMPSQLSGGMARRVALARAMVLDPDLILYDEPFSGPYILGVGVAL
jgi:phospholipid/cholesterol/gamma-HCH transport system ATP-binding protein